MKRSETQLLLGKISTIDNRRLDPPGDPARPETMPILAEWHRHVGHLELGDCVAAVDAHRATSNEWLTPFHVLQGVSRIRAVRTEEDRPDPVPNVDPDDAPAYAAELRAIRSAIASGRFDEATYEAGGVTLTGAAPWRSFGELLAKRDGSFVPSLREVR